MRAVRRSRVTPAVESTMAIRRLASQLKMDDLPTFGRPMMATIGSDTSVFLARVCGGDRLGPATIIPCKSSRFSPVQAAEDGGTPRALTGRAEYPGPWP